MMLLKILLVLLQFFKGITSLVSAVSAVVDHSAILPCDVSNCMDFHWIKNHPITAPVAECIGGGCVIQEGFQGRFKLADNINNGNYSLLINSVKFNDRGTYQCKCDDITNDVRLQVDVYINVTAEESANITLQCYADTQTDVNDVTWIHNDQQKVLRYIKDGHTNLGEGYEGRVSLTNDGFKYGDLSLTLTEVQKSDAGLYRCFVDNGKTKGYPHIYRLHVKEFTNPGRNQTDSILVPIVISFLLLIIIILVLLCKMAFRNTPEQHAEENQSYTVREPVKESDPVQESKPFQESDQSSTARDPIQESGSKNSTQPIMSGTKPD